jgi:hypothetical protein
MRADLRGEKRQLFSLNVHWHRFGRVIRIEHPKDKVSNECYENPPTPRAISFAERKCKTGGGKLD